MTTHIPILGWFPQAIGRVASLDHRRFQSAKSINQNSYYFRIMHYGLQSSGAFQNTISRRSPQQIS